jgi:hypothetical protein
VFVGVVDEQRLEVGAARGEYHLVGAEELSFHGQRDVDELSSWRSWSNTDSKFD